MSRLMEGAMIVLFVLVVGAVIAYIKTSADAPSFEQTCEGGNATACAGNPDDVSFLDQVSQANPTEIDEDAPAIINTLWLLAIIFLLAAAIALIALAFIPLTS